MSEQAIVERSSDSRDIVDTRRIALQQDQQRSLARRALDAIALQTLGPEYDERIEALKRDTNEFGVDPFGVDPDFIRSVGLISSWLYRFYFRVKATGLEHMPEGRVLIISNHSGQIPFDGAMIATAMLLEGDPPRVPRTMVERWSPTIPYVSIMFSRTGQIVGMPENATRLLDLGHGILVFPEGAEGSNKLFSKAYQLQDFGLGFMRLALETDTPIVPVSVIGAEEQYPAVYNLKKLARLLGAPAIPVTPLMALPVVGMLPLPTKYRIHFGEPMHFDGDPDDDDSVIGEKVQLVRSTVQNMVNRGLRERENVFW